MPNTNRRQPPCATHDFATLRVLGSEEWEHEDGTPYLVETRTCDVCRRSFSQPLTAPEPPQAAAIMAAPYMAPIVGDTIRFAGRELTCLGWDRTTWCTYALFVGDRSNDIETADARRLLEVTETNWALRLLAALYVVACAAIEQHIVEAA